MYPKTVPVLVIPSEAVTHSAALCALIHTQQVLESANGPVSHIWTTYR